MTLRGLLVDMDGTLLDSEKVWDVALNDLATWLGGSLSERARARMVGSSLGRSVAIVHDDLGIDADPESSGVYLLDRMVELFRTDLRCMPGARELLECAGAARVPTALVTSTHRQLTEIALDTLGRQRFAATVCGDEVTHPKPAPDPYLRACALLGVSPHDAVAVEDSLLGAASARAAGCAVLTVPSDGSMALGPGYPVRASLVGLDLAELAVLLDHR